MRLVVFAFAWGLFTGWEAASWVVGVPAVCVAAWLSVALRPPGWVRLSVWGLIRLFPYFVWQSIRAGGDVAVRALRGPAAIDPIVRRVPARLPDTIARVMVANVTTLLPGTLAVDVEGDDYVIHALNGPDEAVVRDVRDVEARVAPVFGQALGGPSGS